MYILRRASIAIALLVFLACGANAQVPRDLAGRWEQLQGLWKAEIAFMPDGGFVSSGFTHRYKVERDEIVITIKPVFGEGSTSRHKYSISNGILTVDPPIWTVVYWRKLESFAPAEPVAETVEIVRVELDPQLRTVRSKQSPIYTLPAGTEQVFEDVLRVAHTVTSAEQTTTDQSFRVNWAALQVGIRNEVQRSSGRSSTAESEVRRSIKLVGSGKNFRIVWNDLYRYGQAIVRRNGALTTVPFFYREGFDLSVESVE